MSSCWAAAAGLLAAVSAARNGASVLLVERYGFLGGMGTAAGVSNFCGLHANVRGTIRQVVHGMTDELLDRMRALDGLNEPHLILGKIHARPTTSRPSSARPTACCGTAAPASCSMRWPPAWRAAPMATWTRYSWKPSRAARVRAASSSTAPATPTWRPGPACL